MQKYNQAQIWSILKDKLPFQNTPEQTQKRNKIWPLFDVNGNKYVSLAEVDKGVRDVLKLPQLFNLKKVIIRAFNSAKNAIKASSKYGDDYVSKAQFKYLLRYLRQYYQYWIAFDRIDTNNDNRISINEFTKAVQMMKKWNINITNPQESFKQADKDGKGMILFDQFVQWANIKQLDLEDDDDAV